MEHNIIDIQVTNYTFLKTLERNKSYFQQREIKGVDKARTLQKKIVAWPTQTLKSAIEIIKSETAQSQ